MSATTRCRHCGGLNPASAEWCGQCMTRFVAPPPPSPPLPLLATPEPTSAVPDEGPRGAIAAGLRHKATRASAPVIDDEVSEASPYAIEHGPFTVVGETVAWRCVKCGTSNHIEDVVCSACGGTFATTVAEPELRRPSDPTTAALLSLLFPGLGHAYIGDWGAAIARGVLSLWVGALALVMIVSDDIPGSIGLAIVFGFAAAGLWLIAAHDAYRSSGGQEGLVIMRGRRYLYATVGLLGALFMGLMLATFASR